MATSGSRFDPAREPWLRGQLSRVDPPSTSVYKRVLVPRTLAFALGLSLALLSAIRPASVRADPQISARIPLEIGKRFTRNTDELFFSIGIRADVMYGAPKTGAWRFGPALEIRTTDFYTLEGALGAGVLAPLPGDFSMG